MSKKKNENTNLNAFLFILFWLGVLVEVVALSMKHYQIYGFARVSLIPILLIRVFLSPSARKVNVYIYLFWLFSLAAYALTIFASNTIANLGLEGFTISYLSLWCYFLRLRNNHNYSHIVFIVMTVLIASTGVLWVYAPELHQPTFYVVSILHFLVLMVMSYSLLSIRRKIPLLPFNAYLLGTIAIFLSNALYATDALLLHFRFSIVESLIGLGNGLYLFLITRGTLKLVKGK